MVIEEAWMVIKKLLYLSELLFIIGTVGQTISLHIEHILHLQVWLEQKTYSLWTRGGKGLWKGEKILHRLYIKNYPHYWKQVLGWVVQNKVNANPTSNLSAALKFNPDEH